MWPFARKVRCVDCGFLNGYAFDPSDPSGETLIGSPLSLHERSEVGRGGLPDGVAYLYCHRAVEPTNKPFIYMTRQVLVKRQCRYFQPFSPGRDSQAHYELYETAKRSKETRTWQVLGLVAVVVTNAAQILLRIFRVIP